MSHRIRRAAVLLVAAGLMAVGAPAAAAGAASLPHYVDVKGDGSSVTLSNTRVEGGVVTFRTWTTVRSTPQGGGSSFVMFRTQNGADLAKVFADFGQVFSSDPATAAAGTRALTRDADFHGLADPTTGRPVLVTQRLSAGTYYVVDVAQATPTPATLTVVGGSARGVLGTSTVTVKGTSADRFVAPDRWARQGVVRWQNVSDTLHFMAMEPVRAGTTDAQVQAYFDKGTQGPPPFAAAGPGFAVEVVSPGAELLATYQLPPGTYVLLCFVPDDKTGMPHALMGMHKVVVVR